MSSHHIFGIRHHGPGSARSLRKALEDLVPDAVLVEGPPDAEPVLPLLAHPEMRPPVALLVYAADQPRDAVFYPFATFSPEWQAISYGLGRGLPVRMMDLPQWHQLGQKAEDTGTEDSSADLHPSSFILHPSQDPLGWLAQAAGFSDGERWWEQMVEQRRDSADIFAAILEAMAALRAESPPPEPGEARREAWMRKTIRTALGEGFTRVAVVCGAWHGPALVDLGDKKGDAALLKGLPKTKTAATWAPWTYGRLSSASGYGAGIGSPGWYDHLWAHEEQVTVRWMTRVARLLRGQDLDGSAAHAIEAVRLAESLAALRGHPLPGLDELNEASRAVFCFGGDAPMRLIHDQLIVGERMGAVPDETPSVPLQQDLQREQRRLRLAPEATWRDIDLDLRKPFDLERSHLLRRLGLLGVAWGQLQGGGGTGTFREVWRIEWRPELTVSLIEAGIWGNTLRDAARARALDEAERAAGLPDLVGIVNQVLLADLPDAVPALMAWLQERSARTADVAQLMDALVREDQITRSSLVSSLRYGGVRNTDTAAIAHVVDGIVLRICIGLPGACSSLNDDAAGAMFGRVVAVAAALRLLQQPAHLEAWHQSLLRVADLGAVHGLVGGRCCRLLLDAGAIDAEEAARRVGLAISQATAPAHAAAWVEGLLKDSGAIVLHDDLLWGILDGWVASLTPDLFLQTLPLIRRTFATFAPAERRQMGERARRGAASGPASPRATDDDIDAARAEAVLPLVGRLLGVDVSPAHP
ncbi:hypothetical protein K2Z83_18905 [Oscillochloris sp. ZM17-4]|uniref:DUF5682 family protein n=1 Tax=Oscillochloris sp. ZM17-4 TaxID=2866714 RepID=UPI001C72CB10|nr:DUF5682 family protein [Oscillochloris sp. ZM17-4]MBX0329745.1 hypothetical protein [Oscillochloris sp. ZM17-4]